MTTTSPACACIAGTILRRACSSAATTKCARCLRPVCEAHVRHLQSVAGPADVCVECMPRTVAATATGAGTSSSSGVSGSSGWSVASGSYVPDWTDDSGGQFGGGGASGGWSDVPAAAAGDAAKVDAAGFAPEDYAAFDSLTDSDKTEGAPGYDS